MKAAVLRHVGEPLRIADVRVSDPEPDEVLIRTVASGVCHSDRSFHKGRSDMPALPMVLGHEVAGVVEAVGSAVTYVKPGDRVAACSTPFCGTCRYCMTGRPSLCTANLKQRAPGRPPRLTLDGTAVTPFVGIGGFAEQVLCHERSVALVPDAMPLETAALLGCAVITGVGAVLNRIKVQPHDRVAVIGCGGVGLNAVQAARLCGAVQVIAIDVKASKLEAAREMGATHVIDASSGDPVAAVLELTGDGVDHAIEVVGRSATLEQAFAMLAPGATATLVGLPDPADRLTIPPMPLLRDRRLQGCSMGSNRFRLDVQVYGELYLQGRLKLDELRSHTIALEQVDEALEGIDDADFARTVITFA